MEFTSDMILAAADGYVRGEVRDGYLFLKRFTLRQERINESNGRAFVNASNAGTRLRLLCPEGEISFEYNMIAGSGQDYYGFDVRRGGEMIAYREGQTGESGVCRFYNAGAGEVTLWMPITAGMGIRHMNVPAGTCPAPRKSRRLYVAGDSIAQGYLAPEASRSFANRMAVYLDAQYLNQAIGGNRFSADDLGEDIPDRAPDTAIIAFGTNDWAHNGEIERPSDEYLSKFRQLFPDTLTYVILPVFRFNADDTLRRNARGMTLDECRTIIRQNALEHGCRVLNAKDCIPHDGSFYCEDRLHPNMLGYDAYFEGIRQLLEKKENR